MWPVTERSWRPFQAQRPAQQAFDIIPRDTGKSIEDDVNTSFGGKRRAKKGGALHTKKDTGSDEDDCDYSECANCVGIAFMRRIAACLAVIVLICILRYFSNFLYLKYRRNARERREKGEFFTDFLFPALAEDEDACACWRAAPAAGRESVVSTVE